MKRNWFWGTFLLLSAAFIISTRFFSFIDIGLPSIIGTLLCVAFIIQMLASGHFAGIFFPLGILYYIFQSPLDLPYINAWLLLAAALCATIGVAILTPRKKPYVTVHTSFGSGSSQDHSTNAYVHSHNPNHTDLGTTDDEVVNLSSSFSGVSRYLHSQALRGGSLSCRFGSLEVFFDGSKLAPEGATFDVNCSFGAIALHVPRDWPLVHKINSAMGGLEIGPRYGEPTPGAPTLTLTGDVHLGAIEVRFV